MKLKSLLSFILFAAFFVADAQQNNIPSEQKLYIDFNGNTSDNSLSGLSPSVTNVYFGSDRNSAPLRAGKFGGCGDLSYSLVPDNTPHQMDFSTGGTITMWAKPDLNNSMSSADGSCISSGRHTFFSKGGDGFNTPPGFFAYTSINNGVQTISFESSSGSGNVRDSFTLPYTDTWHHYAFVFTTTNLKVYVDGVLKRNATINLNFTEANNQPLYIGTLGPKSTPVNGITYWFPFGGLMDEFRLFTKALTAAEVGDVFQFVEVDGVAPNVSFFDETISSAGSFRVSTSSKLRVNGYQLVYSNFSSIYSNLPSYSKLDWYSDDGVLFQSDTFALSQIRRIIIIEGSSKFVGLDFGEVSNGNGLIKIVNIETKEILFDIATFSGFFFPKIIRYDNQFYSAGITYDSGINQMVDFKLNRIDNNGNITQSLTINSAKLSSYRNGSNAMDWDKTDKLLITGNHSTYIIDLDDLSFSALNIVGKSCKWVGEKFIISNDNNTFRVSRQFTLTTLTTDFRDINFLSNGGYLLSSQSNILKYGSDHLLIGTYPPISYFEFLPSGKLFTRNPNGQVNIYDADFNLLWQFSYDFTISIFEDNSQNVYAVENSNFVYPESRNNIFSRIKKYNSNGTLEWSKNINGNVKDVDFSYNGKVSYLSYSNIYINARIISTSNSLTILNTVEGNPCNYEVTTSLNSFYCSTSTLNSAFAKIGGRIKSSIGLPTDVNLFWERDGVRLGGYSPNVTQSGTYKATVVQGSCSKSITKNVTFSDAYNPAPPTLSVVSSEICEGDSATITFTGCSGGVFWSPYLYDDNSNDNLIKFKPASSGSYTATCFTANTAYGSCRSESSNFVNVSLITFPQNINLAGNSPLSATYRAERINSQQSVIINGAIDYKSKNAIVLNPGFSTNNDAVFNAKIVSSCVE
ncbi:MAG: hypothetical protein ACI9V1_002381 [Spirosomataceae bacterium]|jgi:hypothetical protein